MTMKFPTFRILQGDSLSVLPTLPDNSVDSIVTDPPYELGFMGKSWDRSGIANNVNLWKECLRVLKPGGHLLAFSGSRTYHRMTCAIEDAGFEVRDQIMWVYGSGFPKSLNVSKAIDKAAGAEREVVGFSAHKPGISGGRTSGEDMADFGKAAEHVVITAPATALAKQWDGWGTALKPAHEPICVARKPLAKGFTVADNVVEFGTGAINVDGCRVWTETITQHGRNEGFSGSMSGKNYAQESGTNRHTGRWPANLIHDGSPEVTEGFPQTGGGKFSFHGSRNISGASRSFGIFDQSEKNAPDNYGDSGSASRFFYCAKAGKKDRDEGLAARANNHPTVKPTALMAYLVRLVTPPGGTVLDPFTGSGSTGKAAIREGFSFLGVELTPEYIPIATARIQHEFDERKGVQLELTGVSE